MNPSLYLTARIRKSPFFEATQKAGATQLSVYNKTYMPGGYAGMEAEYWSLTKDVTLWDVTCQRVVEISGPDAPAFMDWVTPRDLSKFNIGQCRYVLLTDQDGGILNDPVLMRIAEDRYWLSSADGDITMWLRGVRVNSDFDVTIAWPDVATLQLQGPASVAVLRSLIGEDIDSLAYYHHALHQISDIPVVLARTGWSAERGYELYLLDMLRGRDLWDVLMEAGRAHRIAPASPSRIRRIEAGIPDYSVDMDVSTNPFEVGLGRLVDTRTDHDYIGKSALQRIARLGPLRRLVGIEIHGPNVQPNEVAFPVLKDDRPVGRMTSWVYSPRLEKNIGLATVDIGCDAPDLEFVVDGYDGKRAARIVSCPFVDPHRRLSRA